MSPFRSSYLIKLCSNIIWCTLYNAIHRSFRKLGPWRMGLSWLYQASGEGGLWDRISVRYFPIYDIVYDYRNLSLFQDPKQSYHILNNKKSETDLIDCKNSIKQQFWDRVWLNLYKLATICRNSRFKLYIIDRAYSLKI